MKSSTIIFQIIFVGLLIFNTGCSSKTLVPITSQSTLPPPQTHDSELPQEILPTLTREVGDISTIQPDQIVYKDFGEFGVEINSFDTDFEMIRVLGAKWVRYNGVVWSDIEPIEGEFAWDKLVSFEAGLIKAQEAGLKMIVVVRSTPTWAQNRAGYYCGQIQAEKNGAFGNFMAQLVARYSAAPFNARYWELWNEPDVDPSLVSTNHPFGCWGDKDDAYYGGQYYGEMLGTVVPLIHAAAPDVFIISGGIILDCDPASPGSPGRCKVGSELPPRFIEGVLEAGGGDYIDFLGFHGGPPYNPVLYSPVNSVLNMPSWQARGGVIAGKVNYLNEIMTAYNVDLPVFLTETSFSCPENWEPCNPVSPDFFQKQAEYGAWLVVNNYAENINTIWYTLNGPGWRNGALLDKDQNPRPVYYSIQTALRKIDSSIVLRKIDEIPGLTGYEFQSQTGKFLFLAPTAEEPPQWSLPENAVQATDIFGQAVSLESLSPLSSPVFIDLK